MVGTASYHLKSIFYDVPDLHAFMGVAICLTFVVSSPFNFAIGQEMRSMNEISLTMTEEA